MAVRCQVLCAFGVSCGYSGSHRPVSLMDVRCNVVIHWVYRVGIVAVTTWAPLKLERVRIKKMMSCARVLAIS